MRVTKLYPEEKECGRVSVVRYDKNDSILTENKHIISIYTIYIHTITTLKSR